MHRFRSETFGETFCAKKSHWESRIGLYAWLQATLSPRLVFLRQTSEFDAHNYWVPDARHHSFYCLGRVDYSSWSPNWQNAAQVFVWILHKSVHLYSWTLSDIFRSDTPNLRIRKTECPKYHNACVSDSCHHSFCRLGLLNHNSKSSVMGSQIVILKCYLKRTANQV